MLVRRFLLLVAACALVLLAGIACGDDDDDGGDSTPQATAEVTEEGTTTAGAEGKIMVFAASSLTDAFEEMATAFEEANTGTGVEFQFGGSPTLVTQLSEGATADALATAAQSNMDTALSEGVVADAGTTFARNRLVIIVPADNPAGIETPADLANDGVRLVLALADVPVGRYARESLAKMAADPAFGETFDDDALANLVSEEPNVKAVVTKVQLGEADAGIVYVTDVTPDVEADLATIEIVDAYNVIAEYPIAVTAETGEADVAEAFIDFILSDDGQAILEDHGFIGIE